MHKNLVTSPRRYLIQPAIVREVSIIIGILLCTYGYEIIPLWYNKNIRSNTLIPFNNVCIERFLTALSLASTLYSNKCTYRHKTRKAWCNYRNIIFIHNYYLQTWKSLQYNTYVLFPISFHLTFKSSAHWISLFLIQIALSRLIE